MWAPSSTKAKSWRRLFLFAEICAVLGLTYVVVLQLIWRFESGEHPHIMATYRFLSPMLMPVLFSFVAACMFLLLVSPFFLRSLRSVAIRAWVVGVAALLGAGLFVFLR
jgi:hypothetical protein